MSNNWRVSAWNSRLCFWDVVEVGVDSSVELEEDIVENKTRAPFICIFCFLLEYDVCTDDGKQGVILRVGDELDTIVAELVFQQLFTKDELVIDMIASLLDVCVVFRCKFNVARRCLLIANILRYIFSLTQKHGLLNINSKKWNLERKCYIQDFLMLKPTSNVQQNKYDSDGDLITDRWKKCKNVDPLRKS